MWLQYIVFNGNYVCRGVNSATSLKMKIDELIASFALKSSFNIISTAMVIPADFVINYLNLFKHQVIFIKRYLKLVMVFAFD